MTRLTRKEVRYEWDDPCEGAFQKLKRRLTSAPILIVSERGQRYTVYCDASKDRLGCVLMQSGRVVAYGSRQLGITMDFVTHLPRTSQKHDAVWVIVDRLIKSAHFLAVRMTFTL